MSGGGVCRDGGEWWVRDGGCVCGWWGVVSGGDLGERCIMADVWWWERVGYAGVVVWLVLGLEGLAGEGGGVWGWCGGWGGVGGCVGWGVRVGGGVVGGGGGG